MIFSRKTDELPPWSIKKQRAYRISRILWIMQIVIALLASIAICLWVFVL